MAFFFLMIFILPGNAISGSPFFNLNLPGTDTLETAVFRTDPTAHPRPDTANVPAVLAREISAYTGSIILGGTGNIINKHNLVVRGDWVNNGQFTDEEGTVVFDGSIPYPSGTLQIDDGINYTSIGTGGAAEFDVAARFEPSQLVPYHGKKLTRISFFPSEALCLYNIRVWTGTGAATLVVEQEVASPVINNWNEIVLDNPVVIDTTQELWIGYYCNTLTGYPAGCDIGPAVVGYGDMIFYGGIWRSIYTDYGLNFNWNITGITEDIFTDQDITGSSPTPFNNLAIGPVSHTTVITDGQTISGVLTVDGSLYSMGKVTLLSTASRTALVDGNGSGNIIGEVTQQRYLEQGMGYRYLGSPFQAATVDELSGEVDLGASFPTLYRYDENRATSGWVPYTVSTDTLKPLQGYAVNLGPDPAPVTIEMNGEVTNGAIQTNFLSHNQPYTMGFNLAGNPYPSPIDWDASMGWTRSGIDDAVYYFNPSDTNQYTGSYSSYVNGVSSDGIAGSIIPSMQGFFIHVTDGTYPVTGTLGLDNQARVNDLSPAFHKKTGKDAPPMIRITASYASNTALSDPMAIYLDDKATEGFDRELDALKIFNTDQRLPNIYTLSSDLRRLSINSIPATSDSSMQIPIGLNTSRNAAIHFSTAHCSGIPDGWYAYLFDALQRKYHDLQSSMNYTALVQAGETPDRFFIVLSLGEIDFAGMNALSFDCYSSGGAVYISSGLEQGEKGRLRITGMTGQVAWEKGIAGPFQGWVDPALNSGVYVVTVLTDRSLHSEKVLIIR